MKKTLLASIAIVGMAGIAGCNDYDAADGEVVEEEEEVTEGGPENGLGEDESLYEEATPEWEEGEEGEVSDGTP